MAKHGRPEDEESDGSSKDSDAIKIAKIGLWSALGVAIVGGVFAIVVKVIPADSKDSHPGPTRGTIGTASPKGSVDQVTVSDDRTQVTVKGEAERDVHTVVVLVGPRPGGMSDYWAAGTAVDTFTDPAPHPWSLVVKTDPHVTPGYHVKAYFDARVAIGGPAPPPDIQRAIKEATDCGDTCLGRPAMYPSP